MKEGKSIYLAARYIRKAEMIQHVTELNAIGYGVPCRWLTTDHDAEPGDLEAARKFAQDDWEDCLNADVVITFTEEPRVVFTDDNLREALRYPIGDPSMHAYEIVDMKAAVDALNAVARPARGGRHVEFGMALARRQLTIVVGPVENVFHTMAAFRFDTFDECLSMLSAFNR